MSAAADLAHAALEEWRAGRDVEQADVSRQRLAEIAAEGRRLLEHAEAVAAVEYEGLLKAQGGPAPVSTRGPTA